MGKRLLAVAIVLAFAAPAGLSLASPARSSAIAAPRHAVVSNGWPARPAVNWRPLRRPGPVGRVFVDIDDVLNAVRPQESALAVLFEVDRPDRQDAAREREELDLLLRRHRDAPAFRRGA